MGTGVLVDMNGDGVIEELCVSHASYPYQHRVCNLVSINGVSYTDTNGSVCGVYPNMVLDTYAIVDLDSSDGMLELAISDWGCSADDRTDFFRYDGKALYYIGRVEGTYSALHFHGDGSVGSYFNAFRL